MLGMALMMPNNQNSETRVRPKPVNDRIRKAPDQSSAHAAPDHVRYSAGPDQAAFAARHPRQNANGIVALSSVFNPLALALSSTARKGKKQPDV
jgi:hypothetical protein